MCSPSAKVIRSAPDLEKKNADELVSEYRPVQNTNRLPSTRRRSLNNGGNVGADLSLC
jgi:hypothetical protein